MLANLTEIPRNPSEWTEEHIQSALRIALEPVGGQAGYDRNAEFVRGEHFRADAWMGPGRDPTTGELSKTTADKLRQTHVSVPEIVTCIETRRDAAVGIEANFSLTPVDPRGRDADGNPAPDEEQERYAAEWAADIGQWWGDDRVKYWKEARKAFEHACVGPATLRVFFDPSALRPTADGTSALPRAADRAEALARLLVVAPTGKTGYLYTDPDTKAKVGIFRFENVVDTEGRPTSRTETELWFSRDEVTVYRRVDENGNTIGEEQDYQWGGLLPIVSLEVEPIIREPQRSLQNLVDFDANALRILTLSTAYTKTREINAQPYGYYDKVPNAPGEVVLMPPQQREDGTYYFHGVDRATGPFVVESLFGFPYTVSVDENGKTTQGITTPSVDHHDPPPPETVITAADWAISTLRDSTRQGHRNSSSTAEASGDAYEQKRAIFESDVESGATETANTTARLLTVLTVMADWQVGVPDPAAFAREWIVSVTGRANPGPVSSAKRQELQRQYEAGMLPLPLVLQQLGVQDVPTAIEQLQQHKSIDKRAAEAKALTDMGVNRRAAWLHVGFSPEEVEAFMANDTDLFTEE